MFLVGLTGGIATGKSSVARLIQSNGTPVIDADLIARTVVEPGKPAWKKIKQEFGDEVLKEDGTIDRTVLGNLIFSDPSKRRLLNKITHPYIHRAIILTVFKYFFQGYQFVVLDLPLLFESGLFLDYINKTIVVNCDEEKQFNRLMDRNNFSREEAERRIKAQMPLEEKCRLADFVIDNNGSLDDLKIQTEKIYEILRRSRAHWKMRVVFFGWLALLGAFFLWIYTQIPLKSVKNDTL